MQMQITKISEAIKETRRIKTIITDAKVDVIPGQFIMVWLPGIDEKPMSLSYTKGNMGFTALIRGTFTRQLDKMKVGDKVGIKGPSGRGFRVSGNNLLLVGGGVGIAPLAPLAENALKQGKKVTAVIGAYTSGEILFAERIEKAGGKVFVTTEDGSAGTRGLATDVTKKLLGETAFDECFTCGPEPMMTKVLKQTNEKGIPTQLSLERYFKCGMGLCGHCAMDSSGLRVCMDGPVFSGEELKNVSEFGTYRRDSSGIKIHFVKEVV